MVGVVIALPWAAAVVYHIGVLFTGIGRPGVKELAR